MSATSTRETPLQDFSTCHAGFVTVLEAALDLPEMVAAAAQSRACAADNLVLPSNVADTVTVPLRATENAAL